jgi:hypothetical protein
MRTVQVALAAVLALGLAFGARPFVVAAEDALPAKAPTATSTVAPAATTAPSSTAAPTPAKAETSGVDELREIVGAIASPAMKGRGAGSPELDQARDIVRARFAAAGLSAGVSGQWLQPFDGPHGEKLANVVGRTGSGEEWMVVGAHYDGLGVGGAGTPDEGQAFLGADDNASGVAALVRIARALAARKDLQRAVYVVAFSGEELGTLGSQWFVEHPPADLSKAVAMLNMDCVGRLEQNKLIVFGTGTAEEFESILKGVNLGFGFDFAPNSGGPGASDQTPFFGKGIPVLHFFSGAKPEYHRPGDRIELLNFEGLAKVADYVAEVAAYIATSQEPLTFRAAGAEHLSAPPGSKPRKVSFGTIPDFSKESGGILLSGVMPGSPAEAAGLAAGDLLTAMDGQSIDNIYDFQAVLAGHAPGDVVAVTYVRGQEKREAKVTLAERH